METKKLTGAKTRLEKETQDILNGHISDYVSAESFMQDLFHGGCQSGIIGELIYYSDTLPFLKRHRKEIESMLQEAMQETGVKSPSELFGNKWDDDDFFARDTANQNLLAWFGFEETARKLAEKNGIEI